MQSLNILVVDDDPMVCKSLQLLLETDRHRAEVATTPSEGLAKHRQSDFDLVLVDYFMPEMRGDALAILLKERKDQPIVLVSAYPPPRPHCVFHSVILKPFSLEQIRNLLSRTCESKTQ